MSDLVLPQVLPKVRIEAGPPVRAGNEHVAFVASYGRDATVSRSLATYISELEGAGYDVVVIRASDDEADLVWPEGSVPNAAIVHKPNIGYDFGSWATGMSLFPQLLSARRVLLVNDSLVGPFSSLAPMLNEFDKTDYDVWGVTNTTQLLPHLQSYVIGFTDGILLDKPLRDFWNGIEVISDKNQLIEEYEVGLSRLLYSEGYLAGAWFDHSVVVDEGLNPSLWGWRRLIRLGFPFVKRQLITLPELVLDGDQVPTMIKARYGVDLHEWV